MLAIDKVAYNKEGSTKKLSRSSISVEVVLERATLKIDLGID